MATSRGTFQREKIHDCPDVVVAVREVVEVGFVVVVVVGSDADEAAAAVVEVVVVAVTLLVLTATDAECATVSEATRNPRPAAAAAEPIAAVAITLRTRLEARSRSKPAWRDVRLPDSWDCAMSNLPRLDWKHIHSNGLVSPLDKAKQGATVGRAVSHL